MAVSFDLFGTLVRASRPADPAKAVADELEARGVAVPDGWTRAYETTHVDPPTGADVPLPAHVAAALDDRDVDVSGNVVRRAVVAAFDPDVRTREGAVEAVETARDVGPVGVLSNCSVPELVGRTLVRSDLDRSDFDAVVTSVGCGWRKPHPKAFRAVATRLDCGVEGLAHVGDDPVADGGIESCGGTAVVLDDTSLAALSDRLEAR